MAKKIYILGDSHTASIKKAYENNKGILCGKADYYIEWLNLGAHGTLKLEDALVKVKELQDEDILILTLAGTSHIIDGLLVSDPPFTFVTDEGISVVKDAEIIPINVLRKYLNQKVKSNTSLLKLINNSNCRKFHLSTPPPKGNQEYLLNLGSNKKSKYRGMHISENTLNSPEFRIALWRLEMEEVEKELEAYSVKLLPVPTKALTKNGFLDEHCYSEDFTHANEVYGKYVLEMMEATLL